MSMSNTNVSHYSHTVTRHRNEGGPAWLAAVAGFCASLVGLGLARFAYTPLLPAIVEARWFDAADASWLAAANLAGYLAGALLAAPLSARASARSVLRGMMLLSTLTLLACAWPVDFAW